MLEVQNRPQQSSDLSPHLSMDTQQHLLPTHRHGSPYRNMHHRCVSINKLQGVQVRVPPHAGSDIESGRPGGGGERKGGNIEVLSRVVAIGKSVSSKRDLQAISTRKTASGRSGDELQPAPVAQASTTSASPVTMISRCESQRPDGINFQGRSFDLPIMEGAAEGPAQGACAGEQLVPAQRKPQASALISSGHKVGWRTLAVYRPQSPCQDFSGEQQEKVATGSSASDPGANQARASTPEQRHRAKHDSSEDVCNEKDGTTQLRVNQAGLPSNARSVLKCLAPSDERSRKQGVGIGTSPATDASTQESVSRTSSLAVEPGAGEAEIPGGLLQALAEDTLVHPDSQGLCEQTTALKEMFTTVISNNPRYSGTLGTMSDSKKSILSMPHRQSRGTLSKEQDPQTIEDLGSLSQVQVLARAWQSSGKFQDASCEIQVGHDTNLATLTDAVSGSSVPASVASTLATTAHEGTDSIIFAHQVPGCPPDACRLHHTSSAPEGTNLQKRRDLSSLNLRHASSLGQHALRIKEADLPRTSSPPKSILLKKDGIQHVRSLGRRVRFNKQVDVVVLS